MIEVHGRLSGRSAIEMGRRLTPYNPAWYEEPVTPYDLDLLKEVKQALMFPVAAGERLYMLEEFARLTSLRSCDIVQMDLAHCGGLSIGKKIADMASANGLHLAPHCSVGPVALCAAIHFGWATPSVIIQENFAEYDVPWRNDFVRGWNLCDRGEFRLPAGPGLGLELDPAVILAHPPQKNPFPSLWDEALADGLHAKQRTRLTFDGFRRRPTQRTQLSGRRRGTPRAGKGGCATDCRRRQTAGGDCRRGGKLRRTARRLVERASRRCSATCALPRNLEAGAGTDKIAIDEATRQGIVVANVPDFCTNEQAEHAFGLLLAWARRLPFMFAAMRRGEWTAQSPRSAPSRRADARAGRFWAERTGRRRPRRGIRYADHGLDSRPGQICHARRTQRCDSHHARPSAGRGRLRVDSFAPDFRNARSHRCSADRPDAPDGRTDQHRAWGNRGRGSPGLRAPGAAHRRSRARCV